MYPKYVLKKPALALQFAGALLTAAGISNAASAAQISGTYLVNNQMMCVMSPWRAAATPAYFSVNGPTSTNGLVQAPAGTTYQDAAAQIFRVFQSGAYQLTVNPKTYATAIEGGSYQNVPFVNYGTNPPAVADSGSFTGSGSYTGNDNVITLNTTNTVTASDGTTQYKVTSSGSQFKSDDGGNTVYSVAGTGNMRLQQNLVTGMYRDQYCTGHSFGHRVSNKF